MPVFNGVYQVPLYPGLPACRCKQGNITKLLVTTRFLLSCNSDTRIYPTEGTDSEHTKTIFTTQITISVSKSYALVFICVIRVFICDASMFSSFFSYTSSVSERCFSCCKPVQPFVPHCSLKRLVPADICRLQHGSHASWNDNDSYFCRIVMPERG